MIKKGNKNVEAVIIILIFIVSMLPIWYLAGYARPSGDDYGYSVLTHAAWLETHSLIEVLKAAINTVEKYYTSWNGNWFTVFFVFINAGGFCSLFILGCPLHSNSSGNFRHFGFYV